MTRFVAFACLWLLVLVLSNASCSNFRTNQEKRVEIEKVWSNFPLHPDMDFLSSSSVTGFGSEMITKKFRSKAESSQVKHFFLERLAQDGWSLVSSDKEADNGAYELRFRKGELHTAIEYAGRPTNFEWDYGISIRWTK